MSYLTLKASDNKASLRGVSQPDADIVKFTEDYLVIKVPGHQSGGYYIPAEIQIYEVKKIKFTEHHISVEGERVMFFDSKPKVNENMIKGMCNRAKWDKLFFNHENKRVF